ncbi:hypothetical protein [Aeromonas simiae]|uniref:hypothetical protein n=2 Tax=Aeromonas simiae TaxID=218936 RepID=UPI00266C380A|nr:hypothetical protein [Aeromonas simiae]MDO2948957.1 thioredoxin family protein [Aeromonas simiae]MDO2952445.1 thioredoxin family protein [Aeromonas simiae]MDO2956649.1 thioredoxin family protein [Aeromonas simiae]
MSMVARRRREIVVLLAGLLAALLGGWFWWQRAAPVKAPEPIWLSGAAGAERAQQQALSQGRPLLYLVERSPGHCRRCVLLHERLFDNPEMTAVLAPFIRVRLNPDLGNESQRVMARLPKVERYPELFLQQEPSGPVLPIKVVVEASQIWVPRGDFQQGNHMPLSPTSLDMALENTRRLLRP